ncbi:APC family permease [Streptomyces sp. Ru71]|uniref:APC family permease n=1 Tax=Streptomyces sp. Ru71 TaxID=2080746 RepID=UPI0021562A88|nr:APC family permease [Streptomyces sp. Ru71]
MATTAHTTSDPAAGKGLRTGALSMTTSLILSVASAAPAYSLAATLAFIVAYVGFQAPVIVLLAFVPILFVSFGYAALNRRDPDCGTIFTWAGRVLGPRAGFMAGWAVITSFVLVMASLAQVAGQYVFLLCGADGIGSDPSSPWVLLVGLGWMALMTAVCLRGIEVAAAVQRALLVLEFVMLVVFSAVALVRVWTGNAPAGARQPGLSWMNPFEISSPSAFVSGLVLMLFIYWGWETAVTVNEETTDRHRTPGRAAVWSTIVLLTLYLLATVATLAFAGTGTTGIGLGNPDNFGDVFSAIGQAVFGAGAVGTLLWHLLVLMVLSSAAASTETTVLTLGRTLLAMGRQGAVPRPFARIHPRYASPHVATLAIGVSGALCYIVMNVLADGLVIGDAVSSCGLMIAFYYGLTGLTAAWAHRDRWRHGAADLWLRIALPAVGGVVLLAAGLWSLVNDWDPANSSTSFTLPFPPHWHIGGVFLIGAGTLAAGWLLMLGYARLAPGYFRGGPRRAQVASHPEASDRA